MNEIKRQLEAKMGNTGERAARVIQKIEAGKKMKRSKKKSNWNGPIYIGVASFITVLALFLLIGPFGQNGENNATDPTPDSNEVIGEENPPEETPKDLLRKYFKEDGTVAYFVGFGNEYATYTETTTWLTPDFVEVRVDNGGMTSQKIYRITDEYIELIVNQALDGIVTTPTVEELLHLDTISYTLKAPFEDDMEFMGQTMKINVPLTTPYGEFDTLLIEDEVQGTKISLYYAENFGLVGEVYTLSDGTKVESYLASINTQPVPEVDLEIEVYNETTQSTDKYPIGELPFVDPYLFKTKPDYYEMTYRELVSTTEKDLGVLSYACDEERCSHVFVTKEGSKISVVTHAWSSYGNIVLSPDHEIAAIPINLTEEEGDSIIERNQIVLINLNTFKQIIPEINPEYFDSAMFPIDSFTLNNTSITLKVAEVSSFLHEDIAAWYNNTPLQWTEITIPLK